MKTVVLISCVSQKLKHPAKAQDLYISTLFKLYYRYAKSLNPDSIFILSAKYGLLVCDEVIAPYDLTLNNMNAKEVKEWSESVLTELAKWTRLEEDRFIFLAGQQYRKYLLFHIKNYEIPLHGLRIGEQLSWLKQKVGHEYLC